ncbi:DNA polymerase III subunit delta' [Aphanothece hegewaldii CCALA 016]|uniref:DNA polymerase III subunit delta n=1 Tax=Aphanothece hegewaldii CCALA 016 TaxID=2107694 RepID=A0A2T1M164_9CHRO|nr:DNA polymerase III subunit delta' [Aphanothece hegewaldii]PSF38421.1 DNA polymerase III subunit delta' [Aphanothece hegewaldii CCALA 016]
MITNVPINWSELIGQPQAIELLQQAIQHDRIAPAYLFVGASGIGRSIAALCFCNALLSFGLSKEKSSLTQQRKAASNHPDLLWVQPTYQHQGQLLTAKEAETAGLKRKAPPQIRIEQVREITYFLSRPPLESSRLVIIIEDAQTMTEAAANALLKTLEEPGKATLILLTPSTDAVLQTLVSRCQRIPFYRLSSDNMKQILTSKKYEEILNYPELLALAAGSPGEAIASYHYLQSIPIELREQLTHLPTSPIKVLELAKKLSQELENETQLWLVDYLQQCYWNQSQNQTILETLEKARQCLLSYVQPRLVWECTLLNLCQGF